MLEKSQPCNTTASTVPGTLATGEGGSALTHPMVKRTSSGFKKLNDEDHSVSACPLRIIRGERTKRTAHLCHHIIFLWSHFTLCTFKICSPVPLFILRWSIYVVYLTYRVLPQNASSTIGYNMYWRTILHLCNCVKPNEICDFVAFGRLQSS